MDGIDCSLSFILISYDFGVVCLIAILFKIIYVVGMFLMISVYSVFSQLIAGL